MDPTESSSAPPDPATAPTSAPDATAPTLAPASTTSSAARLASWEPSSVTRGKRFQLFEGMSLPLPPPPPSSGDGGGDDSKRPFPKDRIVIVIDDSGSTENSGFGGGRGGSGGRRGRCCYSNAPPTPPTPIPLTSLPARQSPPIVHHVRQTPIILVAEIEAVFMTLAFYCKTYNMTGVRLDIFAFSDSTRHLVNGHIFGTDSHSEVLGLIADYGSAYHQTPEFAGTRLWNALQTVSNFVVTTGGSSSRGIDLIIATDGRPTDGPEGEESFATAVSKMFPRSTTRMIAIGAGSISTGIGGRSSQLYRGGNAIPSPTSSPHSHAATTGGGDSECNIKFIVELAKVFDESVYVPACNDYSILIATLAQFFSMTAIPLKLVLTTDNDGLIEYPQTIADAVLGLSPDDSTHIGVIYTHPTFGSYAVFRTFQVAVKISGGGDPPPPPDGTLVDFGPTWPLTDANTALGFCGIPPPPVTLASGGGGGVVTVIPARVVSVDGQCTLRVRRVHVV